MTSNAKVILIGAAAAAVLVGLSWVSLREVNELSSSAEDEAPEISLMDMSTITDAAPSYVLEEDEGIYGTVHASTRENINLENCRIDKTMLGVRYADDLSRLVLDGHKLDEKVDWTRIPSEKLDTAGMIIERVAEQILSGKAAYVTEQCEVGDALIVRILLIKTRDHTELGRMYDYEHAENLLFTFYPVGDDYRFIPYSIL